MVKHILIPCEWEKPEAKPVDRYAEEQMELNGHDRGTTASMQSTLDKTSSVLARLIELQAAVYDAVAQAPRDVYDIVAAGWRLQRAPDPSSVVRMFRSFVAKCRLRRSVSFEQHLKEWHAP